MSSPAVARPAAADGRPRPRARPRRPRRRGLVPAPGARSSTCSCSCRSSSSSCFSFNATNRNVDRLAGLQPQVVPAGAGRLEQVQKALWNSATIAFINAILATHVRDDGGARPAARPAALRIAFDALTYVSIIIPEIVIALATLSCSPASRTRPTRSSRTSRAASSRSGSASGRSSPPTCCSTRASSCCSSERACPAWTGRYVEASYDLYATPWRTFRQITFPQLLPAIVAGFLLRSRSASTTT